MEYILCIGDNVEAILLILAAAIMEIVDSSIGMMYGTLLVPILILFNYEPINIVPAILISQAVGGISGTLMHHKNGNANFKGMTRDTKITLAMIIPGSLVVFIGTSVATVLPQILIKSYIAGLVLTMSILCITPIEYKYAMWKQCLVGLLAAFNKALTGGGFGPVTSTGGIMGGITARVSVATTTYAEVAICGLSYLSYLYITKSIGNMTFTVSLCIGALIGGLIGPFISAKISHSALRLCIGLLGVISAIWLIYRLI